MIAAAMTELNQRDVFIDSVAGAQKMLSEQYELETKEAELKKIMKVELGMRFRRVKAVSMHANSSKNLILRSVFAQELIRLLAAGKIIINVDETWLGMSDFRRRKWQTPGSTNSVAQLQMTPRISMIAGLDSRGQIYLSLV